MVFSHHLLQVLQREKASHLLHFQPVVVSLVSPTHELVPQHDTGDHVVALVHLDEVSIVRVGRERVYAKRRACWRVDRHDLKQAGQPSFALAAAPSWSSAAAVAVAGRCTCTLRSEAHNITQAGRIARDL